MVKKEEHFLHCITFSTDNVLLFLPLIIKEYKVSVSDLCSEFNYVITSYATVLSLFLFIKFDCYLTDRYSLLLLKSRL